MYKNVFRYNREFCKDIDEEKQKDAAPVLQIAICSSDVAQNHSDVSQKAI